MAKKKSYARGVADRTLGITTGVIGMRIIGDVGAGLGGTSGMIVSRGVQPMFGLGMLSHASKPIKKK